MAEGKPDPLVGRRIGHCTLQRKLGEGGMGAVYLAEHAGLNKAVAIKILPQELAGNPDFIARFLREARLAARLEHPNVVQVFDVGQADGLYYISMQYVEGRGLDVLLKERGKLAVNEALSVAKRVAVALEAARRLGIVHRDIKPANILLSKDGVVKVADFGLAKERETRGSISEPGQIVGTPHYMAPEQAEGKAVDHRTDIYAIGATLYHLLSGKRPFDGPTPIAIVVKTLRESPPPLRTLDPSIPENVAALVERMMSKSPEARPQTCEELVKAIDSLKAAPAPLAAPAPRRAAMVALPVAGILVLGIVVGLILGRSPKAPAPPPAPVAAPKADPAPPPSPTRRSMLLAGLQDAQERALAEEVLDRTDVLLKALQAGNVPALREMADRLTFGDAGDSVAAELLRRLMSESLELLGWEVEDLSVRPRSFGRPPQATVTLSYDVKGPGGRTRTRGWPVHWVKRIEGGWLLTRAPRGG